MMSNVAREVILEERYSVQNLLTQRATPQVDSGNISLDPLSSYPESFASMSDKTEAILLSWGIAPEQITRLHQILYGYRNLYCNCQAKLRKLLIKSVIVKEIGDLGLTASIPNFFALHRSEGGQCSDLCSSLIDDLVRLSGFMGQINGSPTTKFHLLKMVGQSPYFFNDDRSQHTWLGLAPVMGEGPRALIEELDSCVVLDPSFGTIAPYSQSGYRINSAKVATTDYSKAYPAPSVTQICHYSKLITSALPPYGQSRNSTEIVGLTENRQYGIGLGFTASGTRIGAYLELIHSNGQDRAVCLPNIVSPDPDGSFIYRTTNADSMALSDTGTTEIRSMMASLARARFEYHL